MSDCKTTEACGDCPRVVLGSPLAGESLDEVLDPTSAIDEIVRRYIGKPEYSNLPRKFKTAISGQQDVVHEINDIAFIGVDHPEHGPGLDLWVGGGLSTNPMLAQRVGAWIPLEEVPDVWEGVVSIFRDYGYRRLRTKARLKFLHQGLGHREVPRGSRGRSTCSASSSTARRRRSPPAPIDHVGMQRLQQRAQRGRLRPDRRPRLGHHPDRRSPTRRSGRRPTGSGSRRTRSSSSSTFPTRRSSS